MKDLNNQAFRKGLTLGLTLLALSLVLVYSSRENPSETKTAEQAVAFNSEPTQSAQTHPKNCGCVSHRVALPTQPHTSTNQDAFKEFNQWLVEWNTNGPSGDLALVERGSELAHARAAALSQLIETDVDAALQQILPLTTYAKLPREVTALIEQPVSQVVSTRVFPSCSGKEHAGTFITYSKSKNQLERAYAPSAHPAMLTKKNTPVLAYRLKGKSLLAPSPLYQFQPEEITDHTTSYIDPVDGTPAKPHLRAVLAGQTFGFSSQQNILELTEAITTAQETYSPYSMEYIIDAMTNGKSLEPTTIVRMAMQSADSWTTGAKNCLIIRAQFGDIAATTSNSLAHADSDLQSTLDNVVKPAINGMSYGKTSFTAEATTSLYTINNWTGYYDGHANAEYSILSDAQTLAISAGYNLADYDIVGVCFPEQSELPWFGRATTGGTNIWINGNVGDNVITHEFGHNYGVRHAGHWTVNGSTEPHSASGSFEEYGDLFDAMGGSFIADADYNMLFKRELGWLESSNTVDLKSASEGTYRIYCFDNKDANLSNNRKFVVNAQLANSPDLWIGYRKNAFSINPYNLHNGAYVIWRNTEEAFNVGHSFHLDMTPDSQFTDRNDKKDSALVVGESYTFPGPLKIEVVAQGGSAPDEYIDIKVTLGTPGNSPPTLTSITPTSVTAFRPITFTSDAADSDGDPLSYSWDFGDSSNISEKTSTEATPTKIFTEAGTYTVSLTVGDGLGNFTNHTQSVTVTDPLGSWTKLTTNTSANLNGISLANNKLLLTGNSSILRSSNNGGDSWSTHSLPNTCELHEAAYFNGAYLIVGQAFVDGQWQSVIYRSTDLITFTNVIPTASVGTLHTIAYSDSAVIAAGADGKILRSTDGITWNTQNSDTSYDLHEAAHNGHRFTIVGGNGSFNVDSNSIRNVVIQSSDHGMTWSISSPFSNTLHRTSYSIFAKDQEFILGDSMINIPYSSNNGSTWQSTNFFAQGYVTGITYGQGVYFAAAVGLTFGEFGGFYDYDFVNDRAMVSLDGKNWTLINSPTGQQTTPRDNIYAHGYFFMTGNNGNLWRSGLVSSYDKWTASNIPAGKSTTPTSDNDRDTLSNELEFALGTNPSVQTANPVSLDLTGTKASVSISKNSLASSSYNYTLQRSTNLSDWDTIGTTIISETSSELIIESTSDIESSSAEFYRLLLSPK